MLNILFKIFMRSKGLLMGLLFLLIAGWIGLYTGKQLLHKQQENIEKTAHFQAESIARNVRYNANEMGLLLYYLRFAFVNETPNITALSIGQRDVNPSIQSVNIRNLEAQKYDTDLVNPMHLLLGNLDFSFVLIYFFPLIIIAFCYNLISEEKEEGTWALVLSQSGSAKKLLWNKFLIRYAAIQAVFLALILSAIIVLKLPFDSALGGVTIVSFLYINFWFALCWLVISFLKNSSQNAQILLILWVTLTILAPTTVNNWVINQYPVPETLKTVVAQREGYHAKWDKDKTATMDKFYTHYPQFKVFPLPDKQFSWLWYYAMQQMGDDDAHHEATELKDKLWLREKVSNQAAQLLPTLHTQLTMNDLCQSSMKNHLLFLDSLTTFHEQKRLYFYPKIFSEAPVNSEDWTSHKVAYFKEKTNIDWGKMVLPFVVFIGSLGVWAWRNLRKV